MWVLGYVTIYIMWVLGLMCRGLKDVADCVLFYVLTGLNIFYGC